MADAVTTESTLNGGAPQGAPSGRFTPGDHAISVKARRSRDIKADDQGERIQPMRGYEDTYVDIIDWVIRITDRIWEDQDVGYIYDTYRAGCCVYDDSGPHYGVERVVEGTMQSIHAFPDSRHYADEIIWAGNEDEGFATSHRAINVGHHLGPWRWGEPSGNTINLWVIANCVSEENQIFEEWVLYNDVARLHQCGIDVRTAARAYANAGHSLPLGQREITEVERLKGGRNPEPYPKGTGVEHFVRALFHDTYNRRDLSAIDRAYATTVRWHGGSLREGYGRADVRKMARALMATFPDLGMHVDEVYWMGTEAEGYSVSVRWTATGTHRGFALYGEPTGRRVHIWGLNQLYIRDGEITEEWALFNEFDVLAQLLAE
jgi:predicted ester cyclase